MNGIEISYFGPDSGNVIFLSPSKKTKKEDFRLLKSQLETNLQVSSMKAQPSGISLKLADTVQENVVSEYLRSLGATGGEQIEDAASVAQQSAKDSAEKEKKDMQPTMGAPAPGAASPMPPMPEQQPQNEQIPEGYSLSKIYNLFYESSFFKPNKVKKNTSSRPGRRTGKYWENIERILGKNRQKVLSKDVLVIRSNYNKKPSSEERDDVLKSLDRAFNYFHRKIKEESGTQAAKKYAYDYYALDNLYQKDYSGERNLEKNIPEEPEPPQDGNLNGPDFSEYLKDLSRDDEYSYDDIEVDERTF